MERNYQHLLLDLLPPGGGLSRSADSNVGLLMLGLADELERVDDRCQDLMDEADPSTADELLDGWESTLGLPDEIYAPTVLADRQDAVVSRLRDRGDQSRSYYQAKAVTLGFPRLGIGKSTFETYRATSTCVDALYSQGWQHWLKAQVIGTYTGVLDQLKSFLQANKQAHKLLSLYTGLLSSWTSRQALSGGTAAVGYDARHGRFVAVSYEATSRAWFSDDGKAWYAKSLPDAPASLSPADIWHDGERWVLVGDSGVAAHVYYSDDGENWVQATSYHVSARGVVKGNGRWVSVGSSGAQWSTDGATWNNATVDTSGYVAVGFGAGVFVAVGDGLLWSSTDGDTWTARTFGGGVCASVAFGNGLFVVATEAAEIYTSPDGTTWTTRSAPELSRVRFADRLGLFFAVGGGNSVYCSRDGITWATLSGYGASTFPLDIAVVAEIAVLADASRLSTSEGTLA